MAMVHKNDRFFDLPHASYMILNACAFETVGTPVHFLAYHLYMLWLYQCRYKLLHQYWHQIKDNLLSTVKHECVDFLYAGIPPCRRNPLTVLMVKMDFSVHVWRVYLCNYWKILDMLLGVLKLDHTYLPTHQTSQGHWLNSSCKLTVCQDI